MKWTRSNELAMLTWNHCCQLSKLSNRTVDPGRTNKVLSVLILSAGFERTGAKKKKKHRSADYICSCWRQWRVGPTGWQTPPAKIVSNVDSTRRYRYRWCTQNVAIKVVRRFWKQLWEVTPIYASQIPTAHADCQRVGKGGRLGQIHGGER